MGHSSTQPSGHLSGHASESHRSDPSRSGHRSIAEGRWQSVGLGVLRYADGVNTYAVRTEPGHIVIIDPGRGRWWHHLDQIGVTMVDAVVITHLHRDGVCGLYRPGPLADEYRGDIFLPTGDLPLADDIKAFCKRNIAHFKMPAHVRFKDELPMTVTGKPQKFIMRDQMMATLGLPASGQDP